MSRDFLDAKISVEDMTLVAMAMESHREIERLKADVERLARERDDALFILGRWYIAREVIPVEHIIPNPETRPIWINAGRSIIGMDPIPAIRPGSILVDSVDDDEDDE